MKYFARVSLERAKAAPGTEYYYAGRGMPELSKKEFNAVMAFDKMSQADRLAVIVAGVNALQGPTERAKIQATKMEALLKRANAPDDPYSLSDYLNDVQHLDKEDQP